MKNLIKICTFNIRYGDADDGINSWPNRKGMVINSIIKNSPDIIGFQEALPHVRDFLEEKLPQYMIVGNGRGQDYKDEYNCIAIKRETVELLSLDTIWLSETPDIPGSQLKNNDSCPRICTTVTLRSKFNNQLFRVFNTHLDYKFPHIRIKQLEILNGFIDGYEKRRSLPSLLLGDLNCTPDSDEYSYIINDFTIDLVDLSTVKNIGADFTFHDYFSCSEDKVKIDYIFATGDIEFVKSYLDDTENDHVYLSDHYPIYAEVLL